MADISKLGPGCDDDCEGERGERGERGHRGRRGPTGPTGPAGSTESIIILGTNPDTLLIAGENGSGGQPIYIDLVTGKAFLALDDTEQHARVVGLLGPLGMTAGLPVPSFTAAGELVLPTSTWDAVTGDVGGLTPGAAYYLNAIAGRLTKTKPTDDDVFLEEVGIAITTTAMLVQINLGPQLASFFLTPAPTSAFATLSAGLEVDAPPNSKCIIPYCPGDNGSIFVNSPGPVPLTERGIGFGATFISSASEDMCWAAPFTGTAVQLQVNVSFISNASIDFEIRKSATCNGPFVTVLAINNVTVAGCYSISDGVTVNPGDRFALVAVMTKLV